MQTTKTFSQRKFPDLQYATYLYLEIITGEIYLSIYKVTARVCKHSDFIFGHLKLPVEWAKNFIQAKFPTAQYLAIITHFIAYSYP